MMAAISVGTGIPSRDERKPFQADGFVVGDPERIPYLDGNGQPVSQRFVLTESIEFRIKLQENHTRDVHDATPLRSSSFLALVSGFLLRCGLMTGIKGPRRQAQHNRCRQRLDRRPFVPLNPSYLPYLAFKPSRHFCSPSFKSFWFSQKMVGISLMSKGSFVFFFAVSMTCLLRAFANPTS